MKARIFIYTIFTFICLQGNAQSCGTTVSSEQILLENTLSITSLGPTESLPKVNRNLSVAFYVVLDSLKNPGVTEPDINAAIAQLNEDFSPINLQFHLCSINYVSNYQLDNIQVAVNEDQLTVSNFTKNVINVYLATSLLDPFMNSISGYTYMPGSHKNSIFLSKFFITERSELSHQMGHFFNLYHTHESTFGRENVARTNCSTAGDRCCDTEADPNIFAQVNTVSCLYTGTLKDENNEFYTPSAKNIMSYSNDRCRCYFSPHQFRRIAHAVLNLKKELR